MTISIGVPSIKGGYGFIKKFITRFGIITECWFVMTSSISKLNGDGVWLFKSEPTKDFFKMYHFGIIGLFFFYEYVNGSFGHIVHSNSSSVATIMRLDGDKN
jgi:hypothetical protein